MGLQMSCIESEKLGRYFDGELGETERAAVEGHLSHCTRCESELAAITSIRHKIVAADTAEAPVQLWAFIAASLEKSAHSSSPGPVRKISQPRVFRKFGAAASIAAAVGIVALAVFWIGRGTTAHAALDFAILLDSIADGGAVQAFDRFIVHHGGRAIKPDDAHRSAPDLDFEVPPGLPGGWQRGATYCLDFGGSKGIAAAYTRDDGEFMAAIFHPPVRREDFGSHKDLPCVIGKHRGHSVEVGEWRMVHLTDPSTCHCILSRIADDDELAGVMAAVAPRSKPADGHGH
jgi:hypothetical protein